MMDDSAALRKSRYSMKETLCGPEWLQSVDHPQQHARSISTTEINKISTLLSEEEFMVDDNHVSNFLMVKNAEESGNSWPHLLPVDSNSSLKSHLPDLTSAITDHWGYGAHNRERIAAEENHIESGQGCSSEKCGKPADMLSSIYIFV